MANIELSQEYENLKNEIQELKERLTDITLDYNELQLIVCRNIKTQYMLEVGGLEYEVYQSYCTFLRLKRKIEMIRVHKYRREKVNIKTIEETLDKEFADYQKRLDDRAEEITKAEREKKKEILGSEETRELKKLYRKLIKKLHPDLHPHQSQDKIELFHKVVEAYEDGDLIRMQGLALLVDAKAEVEPKSTMEELEDQKKRLIKAIKGTLISMYKLKTTTPYIWKEILDDPIKKEEKLAELKEAQKSFKDAIDTLEEIIKNLLEETDDR